MFSCSVFNKNHNLPLTLKWFYRNLTACSTQVPNPRLWCQNNVLGTSTVLHNSLCAKLYKNIALASLEKYASECRPWGNLFYSFKTYLWNTISSMLLCRRQSCNFTSHFFASCVEVSAGCSCTIKRGFTCSLCSPCLTVCVQQQPQKTPYSGFKLQVCEAKYFMSVLYPKSGLVRLFSECSQDEIDSSSYCPTSPL